MRLKSLKLSFKEFTFLYYFELLTFIIVTSMFFVTFYKPFSINLVLY